MPKYATGQGQVVPQDALSCKRHRIQSQLSNLPGGGHRRTSGVPQT